MPRRCSLVALSVTAVWLSASVVFVSNPTVAAGRLPHDSTRHGVDLTLSRVEAVLDTTAKDEFQGREGLYQAAASWESARLLSLGRAGPHVACADYSDGKKALAALRELLGSERIQRLSNSPAHGTCFIATASSDDAAVLSKDPERYGLQEFGTLPSLLKISPGMLSLQHHDDVRNEAQEGLSMTYGERSQFDNVWGIELRLSPGVFPPEGRSFGVAKSDFLEGLLSPSIDLHASNFWSDPAALDGGDGVRNAEDLDASRVKEWTRAADVVHGRSSVAEGGLGPADVCSWDKLSALNGDGRFLAVVGLDHLLPAGTAAEGTEGAEDEELKRACFVTLVSYLASQPEVLRVSPLHKAKILNAVARAIIQSATITDTPLTDVGLDGSGEVIQIVDSGLDQNSCYFVDYSGEPVETGFLYDKLLILINTQESIITVFVDGSSGGSFPYDMSRRKVVQYVALAKPPSISDDDDTQYTTYGGSQFEWYDAEGFETDTVGGHGSFTGGTAAGATITTPAKTDECSNGERLTCFGTCMEEDEIDERTEDIYWDFDLFCEEFDCDGTGDTYESCIEEDTATLLAQNGGVAHGAKLTVFDVTADGDMVWAMLGGNWLWNATLGTGTMVHSNSWGGENDCNMDSLATDFDEYMFNNPEHLLLFAVGNDGDAGECNVGSPAIGKNVLAVGASSSGASRWSATMTGEDDDDEDKDLIDKVAFFSSRGPTKDDRIKPELLAPGNQVLSASGAGPGSDASCRLQVQLGTSMSTPVVAASAAMVRQYFRQSEFYATDVEARKLCGEGSSVKCETFSPSAATVKAMLINSANLMGESSEPDGDRGFGRVHLEAGLPLDGIGHMGLFVADSSWTSIKSSSSRDFFITVSEENVVELRATIAWMDPPSDTSAYIQLQHDLDLTVTSPSGRNYNMWSSGRSDNRNVVERVIVPSKDLEDEPGRWTVVVSSGILTDPDPQPFSLVITGPFGRGSDVGSSAAVRSGPGVALMAVVLTAWVGLAFRVGAGGTLVTE